MLRTEDFEQMVVASILADAGLDKSVDALLGHLLSAVSGYSGRPTDGVVFECSDISDGTMVMSGVVVLIDQTVEPFRVELALDATQKTILQGVVYFGDTTRAAIGYGTRDDRNLRNQILLNPAVVFPWKECFRRDARGWHREWA